ncbi:MAG: hypothetical protein ACTSQS_12510, partial [Promethearchaeota archaeon]
FVEFYFKNKKNLVSIENILANKQKFLRSDNYNFYNLSMVLSGGLGPQGRGFTYSTPRGEVVEICSDVKENEAIIVKYKQFLKQQFLIRLEKELKNLHIENKIIQNIQLYLKDILSQKELINYYNKETILEKINSYFSREQEFLRKYRVELKDLIIKKISNAISIILRPIKMIDQFKCRMDLIAEKKIKSEDIARLTSLKEKSHYDVLRERFFYQYIVEWFYQIYSERKEELK